MVVVHRPATRTVSGNTDVTTRNIVDHSVRHILQRHGDAGRSVIFQNRQRNNFVHFLGNDLGQVRAESTAVRGIVNVRRLAKGQFPKHVAIVTCDVLASRLSTELPVDFQLRFIGIGRTAFPMDAVRQHHLVAGFNEVRSITFKHQYVGKSYSRRHQAVDHLVNQFVTGNGTWSLQIHDDFRNCVQVSLPCLRGQP